jgi:hypothetical protein
MHNVTPEIRELIVKARRIGNISELVALMICGRSISKDHLPLMVNG